MEPSTNDLRSEPAAESLDFGDWTRLVRRFAQTISLLTGEAEAALGVPLPTKEHWHQLLRNKLLPQLDIPPLLVVAVVGGTNIGKSVIFNHLAGENASEANPLAAGTRHPVCLAPPALVDRELLGRIFEHFSLREWHSSTDALGVGDEDLLFVREGSRVPPKLLLLDTPDVDSDVEVNWDRAKAVREAADVLIAVLTQQKYNDAAVKQFFRDAVDSDKPIIVIFNQCHLEADADYWPQWLATFCERTGAAPELVYVVPMDRGAAASLRLPFYQIDILRRETPPKRTDPRADLAELHFDAIKIRTMRGALRRILNPRHGAGAYLDAVRLDAREFRSAAETLSAERIVQVTWPALPPGILVDEIRCWWDSARGPWSRSIHGFYRKIGQGILWSARKAWGAVASRREEAESSAHRREREAVVAAVQSLFNELERLATIGNEVLRPRLQDLLKGRTRERLLAEVQAEHDILPAVDDEYREFLADELDRWRAEHPRETRILQSFDTAMAFARPALTVSLFVSGFVVAGDVVSEAAIQTAGQFATEAAITGGITGGGEAIVSGTGEGLRRALARLFLRLQERYAAQRAQWLADWLEARLLGTLLDELRRGAELPTSELFLETETLLFELRESLGRGED